MPAILTALALGGVVQVSSAAAAPKGAGFGLSPGTTGALHFSATAGQSRRGSVQVRNTSKDPITVVLQAADIRNATNGNADYVTSPKTTGGWLTLSAAKVRLAPGTSKKVPFTFRVPTGTAGGSHYAGIVAIDAADIAAAERNTKAKGNKFNIARINRQALPITIRLPGAAPSRLDLQSAKIAVEPVGAGLLLRILPKGGRLIASARVKVRVSRGGKTVLTSETKLGQLFPGSGLDYRIPWTGRPTTGDYRVEAEIRPEGAPVVRLDQSVKFTKKAATELKRETVAVPGAPADGLPSWVFLAFAAGGLVLLGLVFTIIKLARRSTPVATA